MMLLYYALTFLSFTSAVDPNTTTDVDSLYTALDEAMLNRKDYDWLKEKKISNYKLLMASDLSPENRYEINNKIIAEYHSYNFDSTLKYLENNLSIGQELNNQHLILASSISMARKLINSGREMEAFNIIDSIDRFDIPKELLYNYYRLHYDAYTRLHAQSTANVPKSHYQKLSRQYYDSLLLTTPVDSGPYLDIQELQYFKDGVFEKSLEINSIRMGQIDPKSDYYPQIMFYRAKLLRQLNQPELSEKYLIMTAIRDIELSRKNNAALSELAIILYYKNQLDRANRYINFTMEDARFYNSKFRFLHLSESLPIINEAYQQLIRDQKNNLRIFSLVSTCLALMLLIALVFIFIHIKKLSVTRNELKQAYATLKNSNLELSKTNTSLTQTNHIKEQYIGHFLEICSKYIEKLDNYRKMVHKDLANKRIAELFELTKSNRLIENEQKEFYRTFDQSFLAIYPSFVAEINNLLKPTEQIELKGDELLNTELRILALTRLGITDSAKIARLLRYSVNTIYNYRAQIKNRTKGDRELFDQQILEI
ncbi:DUF6377 domain-containing protein [Reichenbachiella carrageenanivorans]|uniref:DUF6377 domain-containing protein n=1 Tax=Reichenbachiella carrageenanivorans TaxID=2979869 RepID=A0ABY6D5M1_9BACT|nr:DUF6377 domain-containing protein [Reichenbachiella carrageenanivorans]UXX79145.1 DUF6377 domain-containing protein [Reichenbachiella carrageenanivorans]